MGRHASRGDLLAGLFIHHRHDVAVSIMVKTGADQGKDDDQNNDHKSDDRSGIFEESGKDAFPESLGGIVPVCGNVLIQLQYKILRSRDIGIFFIRERCVFLLAQACTASSLAAGVPVSFFFFFLLPATRILGSSRQYTISSTSMMPM